MVIPSIEQMQTRLAEVEGSLARLLNHLPGLAYRCRLEEGDNYILTFVSKGSKGILELEPEEIYENPSNIIERMMPDEDRTQVRENMHQSITAGLPYELFYRIRPASGREKWIWDQGEGIYDPGGQCHYVEGIMMDVTDQKIRELSLRNENRALRRSIKSAYGLGKIIGKSDAMQHMYGLLIKAAESEAGVVLYGETGVGKDLAAQTIHDLSGVKGRYVPVNCGAIPDNLLESEFFGHVRGAFSGAVGNNAGLLAAADGGTLFLDEVAELPLKLQVKLLRAIESKTYTQVGSSEPRRSNFRLISATNQDLHALVQRREIREDFFYRIHVLAVHVPPLRIRRGDLPLLVDAYARQRGIAEPIPADLLAYMEQYPWPGNIRELHNSLDRYWAFGDPGIDFCAAEDRHDPYAARRLCSGGAAGRVGLAAPHAPGAAVSGNEEDALGPSLRDATGELEKYRIKAALDACHWRKGKAAEALGVTMRTLQRKMKKYGMTR